jgi:hypothetical protein
MDADGMCMEMRDIHIHRQTDRRTHLYTNTSMMMKIMRS